VVYLGLAGTGNFAIVVSEPYARILHDVEVNQQPLLNMLPE